MTRLVTLLIVSAWISPSLAHAAITPLRCVEDTLPFNFESNEFEFFSAGDPRAVDKRQDSTANHLRGSRYLIANKYVSQVILRADRFSLADKEDYLLFGEYDEPLNSLSKVRGEIIWDVGFPAQILNYSASVSLQYEPLRLYTHTNKSRPSKGYRFTDATLVCDSANSPDYVHFVVPSARYTGFLMAREDAVTFSVVVPEGHTDIGLEAWINKPSTSSLEGIQAYARCNASSLDDDPARLTQTLGKDGFLHLTGCESSGYWSITLASSGGSGSFDFVVSPHWHKVVRVGVTYAISDTELDLVKQTLTHFARLFFGMTEGHVVMELEVTKGLTECPGNAIFDVCLTNVEGNPRDRTNAGPPVIRWYSGDIYNDGKLFRWGPAILAHEFGHAFLRLQDEYEDLGPPFPYGATKYKCGHSMMGALYTNVNNLCDIHSHGMDAFYDFAPGLYVLDPGERYDSGFTPIPPSLGLANGPFDGDWVYLREGADWSLGDDLTLTPDNYDYHSNSFLDSTGVPMVGNVTVH